MADTSMRVWLADTSVRTYRRKDGQASVRLRSYLMIRTNCSFRLSAYLKDIACSLLPKDREEVQFDEISYTENCIYSCETMVHGFWAAGVSPLSIAEVKVAKLRLDYHISFTGHPSEAPDRFEVTVPVVNRACGEYMALRQFEGRQQPPPVHWVNRGM